MRKKYWALIFSLFLLDRISKEIIRKVLAENSPVSVIGNFLRLTYITNTGIAFGLARGKNILFLILNVSILAALIAFFAKAKDRAVVFASSLIVAGAMGNIFDRIAHGSVCDFIEVNLGFPPFNPWPIFNLADSLITVGGILLFYLEFLKPRKPSNPEKFIRPE